MSEDLQKHRDSICEKIDRDINLLSQIKKAIEADDINEVGKLKITLLPLGENLFNAVDYYIGQRSKSG